MKLIGYARTTIIDNDLDDQIRALTDFGCDEIYHEAFNVTDDKQLTSELETVLNKLQTGDALVICRLNRLGRPTRQLTKLTQEFKESGVHLISLDDEIDTRDPMGDIYFKTMNCIAMLECNLIKERTLVGLNNARKKGKIGGRPKIDVRTIKRIRHLYHEKRETIQYIALKCNVSIGTCYKYINLSEHEVANISQ